MAGDILSKPEKTSKPSILKDYILPVIIALGIVVLIRTFLLGMFYVPSESMVPTLQVNDHVVVTKLSYKMHEPERGDIVVFKYPPNEEQGLKEVDYVKRLIGLPGEKLEIKDNRVLINGRFLEESYLNVGTDMPDYGPIIIPQGQYFMMGDNRNNSSDSRVWGFVPKEYLIGKAQFIYWPFAHIGGLN